MSAPRLTVAIPVFNRKELVKKALESALAEPARDIEVLVVDNASTDGTWEVLESYDDPRLRLVRNPRNLGLFGNFNRCFELASAPYVCTLCSDDVLLRGFLGPAADVLDRHPEVSLVSSRGRGLYEGSDEVKTFGGTLPAGLYSREDAIVAILWAFSTYYVNPFNGPSGILVRTERARRAGGMDETMAFGSDVRLYLKMLETSDLAIVDLWGCEMLHHREQIGARIHDDDRSFREMLGHFETYRELLERRGVWSHVRRHLAGYLLGSSFRMRRLGHSGLARRCLELMRERGLSIPSGVVGGIDSYKRRSALRKTGRPINPIPMSPIEAGAPEPA